MLLFQAIPAAPPHAPVKLVSLAKTASFPGTNELPVPILRTAPSIAAFVVESPILIAALPAAPILNLGKSCPSCGFLATLSVFKSLLSLISSADFNFSGIIVFVLSFNSRKTFPTLFSVLSSQLLNSANLPTSLLSSLDTTPPATAAELIMPPCRAEKSALLAVTPALPIVSRLFLSTLVSATEAPTPAAVPIPRLPATLVIVLLFSVCKRVFPLANRLPLLEVSLTSSATFTLALSVPLTILTMATMPALPPCPAPAATLK